MGHMKLTFFSYTTKLFIKKIKNFISFKLTAVCKLQCKVKKENVGEGRFGGGEGSWEGGEVGRWGDGEVEKWGCGKVVKSFPYKRLIQTACF